MNPLNGEARKNFEIDMSSINRRLLALWSETAAAQDLPTKRTPLIYPSLEKHSLVFVGLNPSYTASGKYFSMEDAGGTKHISYDTHLRWDSDRNTEEFLLNEASRLKSLKTKYNGAYFKPLAEIATRCNLSFEHIDLFAVRETNQAKIKETLRIVNTDGGGLTMSSFAQAQVDVTFDLLSVLEPTLLIVVNALASRLFRQVCESRGILTEFDEVVGYNRVALGEKTVPIFFSSMLSGQRALDTFSRERLGWHANFAIHVEARGETNL